MVLHLWLQVLPVVLNPGCSCQDTVSEPDTPESKHTGFLISSAAILVSQTITNIRGLTPVIYKHGKRRRRRRRGEVQ